MATCYHVRVDSLLQKHCLTSWVMISSLPSGWARYHYRICQVMFSVATVNSRCRRKKSAFNQSENSTAAIGCCILGGQGYALPTHQPPLPYGSRARTYTYMRVSVRTCAFITYILYVHGCSINIHFTRTRVGACACCTYKRLYKYRF